MALDTGFVFVVLFWVPLVTAKLIVYPSAEGAPRSDKYQIYVTQGSQVSESHVYITWSDNRTRDSPVVIGGRTLSWTAFAFDEAAVSVQVHTPRDFSTCLIRPRGYGYSCTRSGPQVAQFQIIRNSTMMSVEFDYDNGTTGVRDITDKLLVFADPPETEVPSKNDSSVLYYDVGVYNLGRQLVIPSKIKQIYLAPGAFVQGGFRTSGDQFLWAAILLDDGGGHTVEGITISNSVQFFLRGLSSDNLYRNVKTVGAWIYNNDGFSIGNNGAIEDCFIHANDDAIKLYASDMRVSRCVVWQAQNGAVFQTGWWPERDIHSITVTDIDVIHTDWCAFEGNNCLTSDNNAVFNMAGQTLNVSVSDIEFVSVRVEGNCPRTIYWKMAAGARGLASNVLFHNWEVESQPADDKIHNEIAGSGTTGIVRDWIFSNLFIGGGCVLNPTSANFLIDGNTTSAINFECQIGKR
ncbi:hypothetical protein C0Q70_01964 [Pomacea canaliculata]|uniref:Uncharacterized protein n=1 Tax=Pomacea canaliculata TaxID=400727 RepID=A0A2T7Q0Y2_POMCA|nr:hypothetical protein C0Q70_01964 [Pomacea canaliculata]